MSPILASFGGASVRGLGRGLGRSFVSVQYMIDNSTALSGKTVQFYFKDRLMATFINGTGGAYTPAQRANYITWHDSSTLSYFNDVINYAPSGCTNNFYVGITGTSCTVINHCYDAGFYMNANNVNYCTAEGRSWDPRKGLKFKNGYLCHELAKCTNCWNGSTNAPQASDVVTTNLESATTADQKFLILN